MGKFLYFSYGSNMLTERLAARCPSTKPVGIALAQGYRLEFSKKSIDTSGKATLIRAAGSCWYGVLFEINDDELGTLDRAEGCGSGYDRYDTFAVVRAEDDQRVNAITYLASQSTRDLRPYDWYLALVVAGAIQHELPYEQIEQLRSVPYDIIDHNQKACDGRLWALKVLRKAGFDGPKDVLSQVSP